MPKETESTSSESTVSLLDRLRAPTRSEMYTPTPLLRESSDPLVAVTAIPSLAVDEKQDISLLCGPIVKCVSVHMHYINTLVIYVYTSAYLYAVENSVVIRHVDSGDDIW